VEAAHFRVSRPPFFVLCVGVVAAWLLSAPLWSSLKEWQVSIHTFGSVLAILLLVLLENSSRRADEAAQEKLNVIAEALASLMESRARDDPELEDAANRLRDSVGLEERH